MCCVQPEGQTKRSGIRRNKPATPTDAPSEMPTSPGSVLDQTAVGLVAAGALPLLASAALELPESERNTYSDEVMKLIAEQKRPLAQGTSSSRRRAPPDSDLDLEIVASQLGNRRYAVKELSPETKVRIFYLLEYSII